MGGTSGERKVSLDSGKACLKALFPSILIIGIDIIATTISIDTKILLAIKNLILM